MTPNTTRNAEIVRQRRAGRWPVEIAREMGLTRNAVIGVLNRAGECRSDVDRSEPRALAARQGRGNVKLTPADVLDIRDLLSAGMSGAAIGRVFGVDRNTIYRINTGQAWGHVTSRQPAGSDGGNTSAGAGGHAVSVAVAPTGADCAASKLNQNEDTAGATAARVSGDLAEALRDRWR